MLFFMGGGLIYFCLFVVIVFYLFVLFLFLIIFVVVAGIVWVFLNFVFGVLIGRRNMTARDKQ